MIDGDHARRQRFHLAQLLTLALGHDALRHGLADPVDAVVAAQCARADGALKLPLRFLGGDRFFQRDFEQSGRIVGILRHVDVARQAIAHLRSVEHQLDGAVAEIVGRRSIGIAEREDDDAHRPARRRNGEVVDDAA